MAKIEVRDRMVWTKHVHEDENLAAMLAALPVGKTVQMRVNGKSGTWEKVDAAALRPIGESKAWWRDLFMTKRGKLVDLVLDEPSPDWQSASDAERDAAWAAFKALTKAGWRSEGEVEGTASRDELHER